MRSAMALNNVEYAVLKKQGGQRNRGFSHLQAEHLNFEQDEPVPHPMDSNSDNAAPETKEAS